MSYGRLSGAHGTHQHYRVVGVHQRGHDVVIANRVDRGYNDLIEWSAAVGMGRD